MVAMGRVDRVRVNWGGNGWPVKNEVVAVANVGTRTRSTTTTTHSDRRRAEGEHQIGAKDKFLSKIFTA